MFDYYLYHASSASSSHRATDPVWVRVFVYSDTSIRVNRLDRSMNMDRWYHSFDELVPLLDSLTRNNRYTLMPTIASSEHSCYEQLVPELEPAF